MARINTNISSLFARSALARTQSDLEVRLQRLSTGLRINRGKDDPAGLIISERLASDLVGISQAVRNAERASSVIATTEASLVEINDLLNSIKALMVQSANTGGLSKEEREANQLQIDSAIESITRISNTATFGGLKLLDGSLDYVTSGIDTGVISKTQIFAASFIGNDSIAVDVDVLASAQKGMLFMSGDMPGAFADGQIMSSMTIQIQGTEGVRDLSFTSGQSLASVVKAVNLLTSLTGVEAELINGNANSGIVFRSSSYGQDNFVSVKRVNQPPTGVDLDLFKLNADANMPDTSGGFPWGLVGSTLIIAGRDEGRDVLALINGNLANGDGLTARLSSPTLSVALLLDETFAVDPTLGLSSFDITGGGSLFQLGPTITALQQTNIGIQSTASQNLGGTLINGSLEFLTSLKDGKSNSLENSVRSNDFSGAQDILSAAIDEVTVLRGRLGAFERNVLDTSKRSLQSAFENLTASRSIIRDADFAVETSELMRAQILQSSGVTVLGLANQQAQQVLQLLG